MRKFISGIFLFSFIIVLFFYVLDYGISCGLKRSHSFAFNNLTRIFNSEINADLLINGSSKALVQISPKILDSILKIDTYNLGMDGNGFILQKVQYDLYNEYNKQPKIIIQIVSSGTLVKKKELYGYMKFAPYLNIEKVKSVIKTYDGFSFYDYNLPLVRYVGNQGMITKGIINCIGIDINRDSRYKGYSPQNEKWDMSFDKFIENERNGSIIKIDSNSVKLFEKYIGDCKKDGIVIFLVYPPTYYKSHKYIVNRDSIITYYKSISKKYRIPFLDYSKSKFSYSKQNFYNSQHLNKKGSELFTKKLGEDIKLIISNKD